MVSLRGRLMQPETQKARRGGGSAAKLQDGVRRAAGGRSSGVPATVERPDSGRTGWEPGAGPIGGDSGSDRGGWGGRTRSPDPAGAVPAAARNE